MGADALNTIVSKKTITVGRHRLRRRIGFAGKRLDSWRKKMAKAGSIRRPKFGAFGQAALGCK
jgi:hypothetical protein